MKKKYWDDPVEMYEATFTHLYQTSGFDVSAQMVENGVSIEPTRTHACLEHGYWCWKNAFENPVMVVKFILRKIFK